MIKIEHDIKRPLDEIFGGICDFMNNTGKDYCHPVVNAANIIPVPTTSSHSPNVFLVNVTISTTTGNSDIVIVIVVMIIVVLIVLGISVWAWWKSSGDDDF